jgi:peptidoglycan/LPS O-acetylase OafA/YrhL
VTFVGHFLDATLLPHQEPLVFVSWTLSYELFFYLVFAATLPLRSRTLSLVVTTGAIVLALLAGRLLPEENALRAFLTHNVMLEFCLGMALAFVFVKWPEMPLPKAWMIGPLLALVAAMPWLAVHQEGAAPEPRALLWGCLSVAILACSLRDWDPRSSLAKLIVLLGGGSYAIYLFHLFPLIVYGYVMREGLLPGWAWAPLGGLFFIGSIAASLAIHIAIERPIMRLLRRSRNPDAAGFVPIARPSADSASNYDAESDKTPPPTPSTI